MLIETSSTVAATGALVPRPAPTPDPLAVAHEVAAHDARTARIERALGALDDLARLRRTHELVEAIERLGAGLGSTVAALDHALGAVAEGHRPALETPAAWEPISTPLVPITAFVAAPEPEVGSALVPAPVAALPVVAPRAVPPAPVAAAPTVAAAPAPPRRARRQAPAGLAAFVIDVPETEG